MSWNDVRIYGSEEQIVNGVFKEFEDVVSNFKKQEDWICKYKKLLAVVLVVVSSIAISAVLFLLFSNGLDFISKVLFVFTWFFFENFIYEWTLYKLEEICPVVEIQTGEEYMWEENKKRALIIKLSIGFLLSIAAGVVVWAIKVIFSR